MSDSRDYIIRELKSELSRREVSARDKLDIASMIMELEGIALATELEARVSVCEGILAQLLFDYGHKTGSIQPDAERAKQDYANRVRDLAGGISFIGKDQKLAELCREFLDKMVSDISSRYDE